MVNSHEKLQSAESTTGGERKGPLTRAELVGRWRNAPEELRKYPAGPYTDGERTLYQHRKGTRLMILGQEVMDSCQTPWANSTVDRAFVALGYKKDVRVLERGFGMGIVATRIMEHLGMTGGEYTCIELNEQDANFADTKWRKKVNEMAGSVARTVRGGTSKDATNVGINIIRGEAIAETEKLAETGREFDIIISDTYPLSEDERSVNDLLDLEQLIRCLAPDGVFAFFGYHTGSDGTISATQRSMIDRYFETVTTTQVDVYPPKDYEYFQTPSGPVRRLPVIICTKPRTDSVD